jgi:diadenylate cyclase
LVSIIDILLVAFMIYQFLMIVRGRRAAHILNGALILVSVYAAAVAFRLELLRGVLEMAAPYAPFALIVMFQSEIRRMLAQIGRRRWLTLGSSLKKREFADEMVLALTQLSQQKTGALVVVERDIGLRTFIESGVLLDAHLSRDLLLSIFQHGSLLHDGAVIVQNNRVAAAACFLPLSVKPVLARELGTRHRAAIGVTEETDCLALVVSEETGRISVAAFGEIEMDVTARRLEERIADHLIHKRRPPVYRGTTAEPASKLGRQTAHDAHTD